MVFKPKYSQEIFDFMRDNPQIKGAELRRQIFIQFGVDMPRNTVHNLYRHHALGLPYKHGHCVPSWHLKPLGTERKDKDGYILVRVEGGEKRKHFIEWEKYHEPTKPDECLIFLDGNKENCNIDNLFLMKRKYMGAVNDCLRDTPCTPELRKTVINAMILKLTAREVAIKANKDKPIHKPKSNRWREIVALYRDGKTTAQMAAILGRNKAVIRWTVRRYNLGFYDNYLEEKCGL